MYEQESYFSLFGLSPQFGIDIAALDKQYLALQFQNHPDRLIGKTAEERAASMQATVRINDAWHTLKSPLKRALYILALHNTEPAKPDTALLMEAMEQREKLADASTEQEISVMETAAKTQMESCIAALEEAFSAADHATAAQHASRLQYVEKFLSEIRLKKLKGIAA